MQNAYKEKVECKSAQPRGLGYMAKLPTNSERIKFQVEEQARATIETQKVNSELSQQLIDLQRKFELERADRENLEQRLQAEREDWEKMMELERTSRQEFEKNITDHFNSQLQAKFLEFSQMMEKQKMASLRQVMIVIRLQTRKI